MVISAPWKHAVGIHSGWHNASQTLHKGKELKVSKLSSIHKNQAGLAASDYGDVDVFLYVTELMDVSFKSHTVLQSRTTGVFFVMLSGRVSGEEIFKVWN